MELSETKKMTNQEFMRARRPELYSDSMIHSEAQPDRNQFEYHLDTLTNRKQETEFETFARLLAEIEICPNLLPQTGPTGGGDSKVDTETYPVGESRTGRHGQFGLDHALLAHWPAHTRRGAPRGAGGLRRTDRRFTGASIGSRAWAWLRRQEPAPHAALWRGVRGRGHCLRSE